MNKKQLLSFLIPFLIVGSLGACLVYQTGGKEVTGLVALDAEGASSAGPALAIALIVWFVVPGTIAGLIGSTIAARRSHGNN